MIDINPNALGDAKSMPAINGLIAVLKKLDEREMKKQYKYCSTTVNDYRHKINNIVNSISHTDVMINKKARLYVLRLISDDVIRSVEKSILAKDVKSFLINIIVAIKRQKETLIMPKQ